MPGGGASGSATAAAVRTRSGGGGGGSGGGTGGVGGDGGSGVEAARPPNSNIVYAVPVDRSQAYKGGAQGAYDNAGDAAELATLYTPGPAQSRQDRSTSVSVRGAVTMDSML